MGKRIHSIFARRKEESELSQNTRLLEQQIKVVIALLDSWRTQSFIM